MKQHFSHAVKKNSSPNAINSPLSPLILAPQYESRVIGDDSKVRMQMQTMETKRYQTDVASGVASRTVATNDDNGHAFENSEVNVRMIEIDEICSISFFRATPLDEFRHKLKECVKSNLSLLSTKTTPASQTIASSWNEDERINEVVRYDRPKITKILTNDVDWKTLCKHHDKQKFKNQKSSTDNNTRTTVLAEVVAALTNPLLVPRCCHGRCLLDVLLNALLVSPSLSISLRRERNANDSQKGVSIPTAISRWTPSQLFLLETIRRLSTDKVFFSDSFMTNYVRSFIAAPPSSSTMGGTTSISKEAASIATTMTNTTGMTPNKGNRLLSAIYWLLSSASSLSSPLLEIDLISSGLLLLQRIDEWDIQMDIESQQQSGSAMESRSELGCCPVCKGIICDSEDTGSERVIRSRKNKMTLVNLSDLHDEELQYEKNTTQQMYSSNVLWRRDYRSKSQNVSLSDILGMKQKQETYNKTGRELRCRCISSSSSTHLKRKRSEFTATTSISPDWSTVRSRAYKKFITFGVERQRERQLWVACSTKPIESVERKTMITTSETSFLWLLTKDAALHIDCPSRRVCLALLAHSLGGPKNPSYFQEIARLFWFGYYSSWQGKELMVSASTWLRLYSEWLSECAVFDQQEVLWEAIQPIVRFVMKSVRQKDEAEKDRHEKFAEHAACRSSKSQHKRHCVDNDEIDHFVLPCLGYILHERFNLFQIGPENHQVNRNEHKDSDESVSIGKEFQSFVDLLSIHFGGSSKPWLSQFLEPTGYLVEISLQRLGILSFSLSDARKESAQDNCFTSRNSESTIPPFFRATRNWPFSKEFTMRKAMGRIEQSVLPLENGSDAVTTLLSCPPSDRKSPNQKSKKSKKLVPRKSGIPLIEYLHDSGILCTIFSFCGSKELARVPLVCKAWKGIVDRFSDYFWEKAYVAQFGKYRRPFLSPEDATVTATSLDSKHKGSNGKHNISKISWRDVFIQKHIAEKFVRFQRNPRSGFKHRTCNYLGCLQILKTANQERKHEQMHLRLLSRQRAMSRKRKTVKKNH